MKHLLRRLWPGSEPTYSVTLSHPHGLDPNDFGADELEHIFGELLETQADQLNRVLCMLDQRPVGVWSGVNGDIVLAQCSVRLFDDHQAARLLDMILEASCEETRVSIVRQDRFGFPETV